MLEAPNLIAALRDIAKIAIPMQSKNIPISYHFNFLH